MVLTMFKREKIIGAKIIGEIKRGIKTEAADKKCSFSKLIRH